MHFEFAVLDFIQSNLRCSFLDAVIPFITKLGNGGAIWVVSALVLILIPKTRKTGVIMAVSLALEALCCNVLIKPLVSRVRPCDVNTTVQLLIAHPTDYYSFPSGHTGISFAAASALYFGKSRLWIPAAILAVLIGFSRLYLYVHYPSDVLAGAFIGIAAGWIGFALSGVIAAKQYEY